MILKALKAQSFYSFLSRLSKKEKAILYVCIFFVSFALLDRLIISPISSRLKELDTQIKERESRVKTSMHILAEKDAILAESAKYSNFEKIAKSEEEEATGVLKEIEDLANKSSVYLVDLKPGGLKTNGPYKKYMVNLNCEAQMTQITEFMFNIENSRSILAIEKYQISPKSKESSVAKCTMTISKIVVS